MRLLPLVFVMCVSAMAQDQHTKQKYESVIVVIKGVRVETVVGDITEEQSEAIVNPTNSKFGFYGAISKSIAEKGGQQIVNDCAKLGTLKGIAMTAAGGQLKCKHVVHLLSPRSIADCQKIINELLRYACLMALQSLSIPLIGGGGNKLARDQVAVYIADSIVKAALQDLLGKLKHIRLVGFCAVDKAHFENAFRQYFGVSTSSVLPTTPVAARSSSLVPSAPAPAAMSPIAVPKGSSTFTSVAPAASTSTPNQSAQISGVTFEVVLGDITDERTDAIVNTTDDKLQHRGFLSKSIVAKGGAVITQECRALGGIPVGGAVVTSGGALRCRYVVHVVAPDDLQECERAVLAVTQAAVANTFTSVSFPPIGAGGKGLPLDQVATCIVDTLADAANQKSIGWLTLIRLVGFKPKEKAAFETALAQVTRAKRNPNVALPQSSQAANTNTIYNSIDNNSNLIGGASKSTQAVTLPTPSPQNNTAIQTQSNVNVINGVTIEVVQEDITDEATDAIVNPTDEKFGLTGSLSKAILAKGGPSIAQECKAIGTLKDVALTSAGTLNSHYIVHVLSPINTTECTKGVRAVLDLCELMQLKSLAIPLIGTSRGRNSIPLDQLAACVTDEVAGGARSGTLGSLSHVRLVGFNQSAKEAFERSLKLSAAGTSALDAAKSLSPTTPGAGKVTDTHIFLAVGLPSTWAPMNRDQTWLKVPVQKSDADYVEAIKLFTLSGRTLLKIFRIQNPTLYSQYQLEKKTMEKHYAGKWRYTSGIERLLYHGTDEDTVPKICAKGVDRSYCGKNGVKFGRGSYFARDMSYSANDTYSKPSPLTGHKYVFVLRVLVGVYQLGREDQQVPDSQLSGDPYDATVDDETEPSIFVIYRDQRDYPEFLFVFT